MMPVTRARTSTSLEPSVWPTYSKATGKLCGATESTLTSAGGKPAKAAFDCDWPQAAKAMAAPTATSPMIKPNQKREYEEGMNWLLSLRYCCNTTCRNRGVYIQSRMFVNHYESMAFSQSPPRRKV